MIIGMNEGRKESLMTPQHKNKLAIGCQTNGIIKGLNTGLKRINLAILSLFLFIYCLLLLLLFIERIT